VLTAGRQADGFATGPKGKLDDRSTTLLQVRCGDKGERSGGFDRIPFHSVGAYWGRYFATKGRQSLPSPSTLTGGGMATSSPLPPGVGEGRDGGKLNTRSTQVMC
jgi:hypothetical protein